MLAVCESCRISLTSVTYLPISFSDFTACHFSLNSDQKLEASKYTVLELVLDDYGFKYGK